MLNNLGMAYGDQGMEESASYCEQALAIHQSISDAEGERRAANNVAKAYFDLRRFVDATEAAKHSLTIQQRANSQYGEGIARSILGGACQALGDATEAHGHFQQALGIFRELDDQVTIADCLSDLGAAYLDLGQLALASECLEESLAIQQEIGAMSACAATLQRLGNVQRRAGHIEQARESLTECLRLAEAVADDRLTADVRADLAALAADTGNPL
jgi:tetratricopeptide (TPR) repeat protein